MSAQLGVAIVGAGYSGPNWPATFTPPQTATSCGSATSTKPAAARSPGARDATRVTSSLEQVLDDPAVDIVAVATPPVSHAAIALEAIEMGKHVLVEKPLATSVEDAAKLIHKAAERGTVLMCDHTYCYTPAVCKDPRDHPRRRPR